MATYNSGIFSRGQTDSDLPEDLASELIDGITAESVALTMGNVVRTSMRDTRIPITVQAPEAQYVTGDTGLFQTGSANFAPQSIMAEQLGVLVPIPNALFDDTEQPIWDHLKPLLSRAAARAVDRAVLFGVDKPTTWSSPDLYSAAVAAGAQVVSTADPVADVLQAAETVSVEGYNPSAVAVASGWQYTAAKSRSNAFIGSPVGAGSPFSLTVAGLNVRTNPVWWDPTKTSAIVADWNNVVIGVRQDVTIENFDQGIVTDDTGKVTANAISQNMRILRMIMRVGYLLATPITNSVSGDPGTPVAVVNPVAGLS